MTCSTECSKWYAPDHKCSTPALPHHTHCDRHTEDDTSSWYHEHHLEDCCTDHCDSAHHITD